MTGCVKNVFKTSNLLQPIPDHVLAVNKFLCNIGTLNQSSPNVMRRFREHVAGKILTVITTLMFLNLSFLLAEVRLLGIDKDTRFSRIISLIVSGSCFEEEKEAGGDTSEDDSSKKIDLALHHHHQSSDAYSLLSKAMGASHNAMLLWRTFETFTPPPEH